MRDYEAQPWEVAGETEIHLTRTSASGGSY